MDPITEPPPRQGPRQGITEHDVHRAADAVLAHGRRPTIDAVRQQLGRGSPNTVMAYLDSWFAHLAVRLRPITDREADEGRIPAPVAQAAHHFWDLASSLAREAVERESQETRERLRAEADVVAAERQRVSALETELQAADKARGEALEIAREQLEEAVRKTHRLEGRINELSSENRALADDLRQARDLAEALRQQVQTREQELNAALHQERERGEAAERRWLTEVETARQEVKKLKPQLEQAVKTLAAEAFARANERQVAAAMQTELEGARLATQVATGEAQSLRSELQEARRFRAVLEATHERAIAERDDMIRGLQWRLAKGFGKALTEGVALTIKGAPA